MPVETEGSVGHQEAVATLKQLAEVFLRGGSRAPEGAREVDQEGGSSAPATLLVDARGRVQGFDREAERLFGRTAADVVSLPVEALLGDRATLGRDRAETRIKRSDGAELPVVVTTSSVTVGGVLYTIFTVCEEQLTGGDRSELRYRHLVEQIPAVVFTAALDGGLYDIYVSPQIENLLGYSQAAWVSDPVLWYDRLHPDDRRKLDEEFARGCLTGGPFKAECRFLTRDDRVVWVHGEARLIQGPEGYPLLLQGVAFDITETKRAEEVVRASLKEKETLLKEIHHRVKNNLQVTSSLLKLQSDHIQDASARQALRESQGRIRSMALVHELLYQSKDLSRVDLGAYVRDLGRQLLRSHASDRTRVRIETDVEEVVLPLDQAVPCGLILNELVSNALEHAFPEGAPGTIHVTVHRHRNHDTLVVTDDGVGIPEDLDLATATTLGLQLVRTLADQIDGTLTLRADDGTEAQLTIPRRGGVP